MCVFFLLPPWKNKALSFPFLFSFLQGYVSPYGCVTCVCVCVVPRLCRGGTSRIDLPWVRNEWSRSDGRNGFLFIYFENWGDSFALQGVCVCVCAVKKRGELKRIKKKPVATQSNSIGTPSSYSVFFLVLPSSTTKLSTGPRQGFPKTKNSIYRIKETIIQRLGNASI